MKADLSRGETRPIAKAALTDKMGAQANLKQAPAGTAAASDSLSQTGQRQHDFMDERKRIAAMVAAVAAAKASANADAQYQPPGIDRPVFTGGAPALDADQMSPAVINSSPLLKILYSQEDRLPWALDLYQVASRVIGPAGAFLNLGYNLWNAKKIFSDPRTPALMKGAIAGSTALAGVSAVTATWLSLAAFKVLPMANEAMIAMGRVAGVAGLGAGTLLAAIDTYNTFTNPQSTAAQKGFSFLSTGASAALTIAVMAGVGGPVGIGLAALTIGAMLAKGYLAHNKVANEVFGAIGDRVETGARAVVNGASAVGDALSHAFSGW